MRPRCQLAHLQISEFLEEVTAEDLGCRYPLVRLVNQHLHYDGLGLGRDIWDKLGDAYEGFLLEIKFHMGRILLEICKDGWIRRPQNAVDFVDLIQLVVSGEERE